MLKKIYNKLSSPKKSKLSKIMDKFIEKISLTPNVPINEKLFDILTPLIMEELTEGNSEIYVAIADENADIDEEVPITYYKEIPIISAGIHEGSKTLWVYSSEKTLLEACSPRKEVHYVKMRGPDLLNLAETNDFQKIIIDQILPLGKLPGDMTMTKIPEGTDVTITAGTPIPNVLLQKITKALKNSSKVLEAYHYLIQYDKEYKVTLGLIASTDITFDEKMEICNSIDLILKSNQFKYYPYFGMQWLNNDSEIYESLCKVEEALVFKRS